MPDEPQAAVTKISPRSADIIARLEEILAAHDLKPFAVIDHRGEANAAGLELRDTKLVIFGSPQAGTPVMHATRAGRARPAPESACMGRQSPDQSELHQASRTRQTLPTERKARSQASRDRPRHRRADRGLARSGFGATAY